MQTRLCDLIGQTVNELLNKESPKKVTKSLKSVEKTISQKLRWRSIICQPKAKAKPKIQPSTMSVASVQAPHLAELCSSLSRTSLSLSSSLSDLVGSPSLPSSAAVAAASFEVCSEAVLTIEDLRAQLGSCFTCGVLWADQQVSLDCSECGGYSLERPCMICDGLCGQLWKRDFTMSHACGKARWQGVCTKFPPATQMIQLQSAPLSSCASFSSHHQLMQTAASAAAAPTGCHQNASQQFLQQELCARLEKLSATAHN